MVVCLGTSRISDSCRYCCCGTLQVDLWIIRKNEERFLRAVF